MKKEVAELLEYNNYDIEVRDDYSGRGMYGQETYGVVCSQDDYNQAVAEVMRSGTEQERELLADALLNMRTDSMGMDMIFY